MDLNSEAVQAYLREPAALEEHGRLVSAAVGVVVLDDLDGLVLEVEVDVEQPRLLVLPLAEEPQNLRRVRPPQAVLGGRHPLVRPQRVRPLTLSQIEKVIEMQN